MERSVAPLIHRDPLDVEGDYHGLFLRPVSQLVGGLPVEVADDEPHHVEVVAAGPVRRLHPYRPLAADQFDVGDLGGVVFELVPLLPRSVETPSRLHGPTPPVANDVLLVSFNGLRQPERVLLVRRPSVLG